MLPSVAAKVMLDPNVLRRVPFSNSSALPLLTRTVVIKLAGVIALDYTHAEMLHVYAVNGRINAEF